MCIVTEDKEKTVFYNYKKRAALLAMSVFCAFALAESPNETHGESRQHSGHGNHGFHSRGAEGGRGFGRGGGHGRTGFGNGWPADFMQ